MTVASPPLNHNGLGEPVPLAQATRATRAGAVALTVASRREIKAAIAVGTGDVAGSATFAVDGQTVAIALATAVGAGRAGGAVGGAGGDLAKLARVDATIGASRAVDIAQAWRWRIHSRLVSSLPTADVALGARFTVDGANSIEPGAIDDAVGATDTASIACSVLGALCCAGGTLVAREVASFAKIAAIHVADLSGAALSAIALAGSSAIGVRG